jgi:hypothetical protein
MNDLYELSDADGPIETFVNVPKRPVNERRFRDASVGYLPTDPIFLLDTANHSDADHNVAGDEMARIHLLALAIGEDDLRKFVRRHR